jgi:BlaI family penicillinase repressor
MVRRSSPEVLGLGPLEAELMRVLWKRGPSLAADVERVVNRRKSQPLAYTTVLNVLLNLEKKGVVDHTVEGRAYRFAPLLTEAELRQRQAQSRARDLLDLFADEAVSAILSEVKSDPSLDAQFRRLLGEGDGEGIRS